MRTKMEKCEISKIVAFRKKGEGGSPKRGSDKRNLLTLCQRGISFQSGKYLQVNCAHWNDNYRRLIYLAIIYQAEWQATRMCRQCKAGQHKFVITTAHDHYFALSPLKEHTLAWSHCGVNGPIRLRLNGSEQQSLNILTMRIFAIKGWLISKSSNRYSNFKSNLLFSSVASNCRRVVAINHAVAPGALATFFGNSSLIGAFLSSTMSV